MHGPAQSPLPPASGVPPSPGNVRTGIVVHNGPSLSSGIQVHRYPMANHFNAGNIAARPSATFVETSEVGVDGASGSEVCYGVCGWIATFVLWGLIVATAITFSTGEHYAFMLMGATVIAFFFYLGTSLADPCAAYLRSATRSCPREYIGKILCNPPKMSMHIECYHETRSTDSKGHTSKSTHVTHTAEEPVVFRFWDDVSRVVFPRMAPSLVRLDLELVAEAADDATLSSIDAQYSAFVARNTSDEYQKHSVKVSVEGFPTQSRALLITEGVDGCSASARTCFSHC